MCQLIEAGLNHQELALALDCSGQTARGYLREYRATRSLSRERSRSMGSSAATWTDPCSLELRWNMAEGRRYE